MPKIKPPEKDSAGTASTQAGSGPHHAKLRVSAIRIDSDTGKPLTDQFETEGFSCAACEPTGNGIIQLSDPARVLCVGPGPLQYQEVRITNSNGQQLGSMASRNKQLITTEACTPMGAFNRPTP